MSKEMGRLSILISILLTVGVAEATICGADDDRMISSEPRVGRIVPSPTADTMCTATMIGPSCAITAGHCISVTEVIEFNVPESQADGTLNHPSERHQYYKDSNFVEYQNRGHGKDWAVIKYEPNRITGKLPGESQSWYEVGYHNLDLGSALRIVGYGVDSEDTLTGVQQAHFGYLTSRKAAMTYEVDTMGGNSGSAVVDLESDPAVIVGIHTNGGCYGGGGANLGTAIAHNEELKEAIAACYESEYQSSIGRK